MVRTQRHLNVRSLRGLHESAVDLHRDASAEEIDRDHEEAFVWLTPDENPFDLSERASRDAHPLTVAQVGIGEDGQTGSDHLPDRLDVAIGHHVELIPSLAQDSHQDSRFADRDVARFVQGVAEEHVARKHWYASEPPNPA